jgi:hypothetical protein
MTMVVANRAAFEQSPSDVEANNPTALNFLLDLNIS